jgi:hypothetical protein
MESAEMISAGQRGAAPEKRVSRISVFPEAVGPKSNNTGIGPDALDMVFPLFFQTEFNLLRKNLTGRQGNHLAVVHLNLLIPEHGKLEGPAGRGAGNLVHIAVIFN